MKKILFVISLVALSLGALADNQPDAIYKLLRRQYTINKDGSMDINIRKELTILRNRALTAYADKGETFITYNPDFEQLTINESYTLTADGRKVVTPQNAFVKQLPEDCADCGRYNHIVEMAVIHTGMEYNCTIVLDYTIHRNEALWSDVFSIQMDCPVEKYEIIFDQTDQNTLKYTLPSACKFVQDGHKFHWVATHVPQKSGESYTSAIDPYQACMKFRNFIQPVVEQTIPEAEDVLADIHKDDKMEYITAIRDWVRDNIHHNPVSPQLTNYAATPAAKVFRSNCGNQLDHYVLLVAMLRQAGFQAELDNDAFNGDAFIPQRLRVAVQHEGMTYLFAMNNHPGVVKGSAREMDKVTEKKETLSITPSRIGENYYSFNLPAEPAEQINPSQLTTQRTQPLSLRPIKEHYEYTIHLDGEYTLLKPVRIKRTKSGLGSIEFTVKQVDGHTLKVVRSLEITPSSVETKQYAAFRQMIIDWNSNKEIMLEKK